MAINFSEIVFSEPEPMAAWEAPFRAGLYVIMTYDQTITPKPYRALYIGESGNLSERGFLRSHSKYSCWIREVGSISNLYVSLFPMPNSTPQERKALETKLIADYRPVCNY